MKLNERIQIVGKKVVLIPYEAKHVAKYHEWMKSPELRDLTASEPLTLDEEYEMQTSWRNDDDKLTFLIIFRKLFTETRNEVKSLVGDTNLFLKLDEDETGRPIRVAEAEIMIAEPSYRGQKLGWEAMLLLMKYALTELTIKKFEVKIGVENIKSINMFAKMNFMEISRSNIFKEVTMEREVNADWINWLDKQLVFSIEEYK